MMNGEQKKVVCAGCGHVMRIPPEFANTPGRCGKCGATVNEPPKPQEAPAQEPLFQTIDLSDLSPRPHKPAVTAPKPTPEPLKRVFVRAMLMGMAGAAIGGTVLAIYFTLRRAAGQTINLGTLFANANTGLVLGFTVCSLYVFVKHLNWGPFRSAFAGLLVCGISATLMYLVEAQFVAPPDMGLLPEIAMAVMAGAVSGLVLGAKLNSED